MRPRVRSFAPSQKTSKPGTRSVQPAFLVPNLRLGTQLGAKLCFAAVCAVAAYAERATELPGQVRSQTEFWNEGQKIGINREAAKKNNEFFAPLILRG